MTLGFQVRFDLRWEWETLIPNETPFPQISHFAISLHQCFAALWNSTSRILLLTGYLSGILTYPV